MLAVFYFIIFFLAFRSSFVSKIRAQILNLPSFFPTNMEINFKKVWGHLKYNGKRGRLLFSKINLDEE